MRKLLAGIMFTTTLVSANCFAATYGCLAEITVTKRYSIIYPSGKREHGKIVTEYQDPSIELWINDDLASVATHDFPSIYGQNKGGQIRLFEDEVISKYYFALPGEMSAPVRHVGFTKRNKLHLHIRTRNKQTIYPDGNSATQIKTINYRAKGDCGFLWP